MYEGEKEERNLLLEGVREVSVQSRDNTIAYVQGCCYCQRVTETTNGTRFKVEEEISQLPLSHPFEMLS